MNKKIGSPGSAPPAVDRRRFLAGAAAVGAAAVTGLKAPAILAQTSKPLKIGFLSTFSRSLALVGENNLGGFTLWLEQNGGQIAGRKVEIIKEDDEFTPQVGLQKLRKLVESDEVDFVVGPQGSNIAMAMVDYVKQKKVFWICNGAGVTALTWNRIPYMFRPVFTNLQHALAISQWYYDNVAKDVLLIASDFAGGRDVVSEFKRVFPADGKIIQEIYPPLNTNDFSAPLTQIRSMGVKGVYAFFSGTDAVRFVQQYTQYGLKAQTRLCCSGYMVETDVLPAQGEAALGITSVLHYSDTIDTPANKAFVAAYRDKYKAYPSVFSESGYVSARMINDAVVASGGDAGNKDKVAEAMAALKIDAPRGPLSFDPVTHQVIGNVYIREVAKMEDGRLANKVIATVPNVRDPGVKPG